MAERRAGKAPRLLALVRDLDSLDAQCRDEDRAMMVFAPTQTVADNVKTMLSTRLNRGEENTVVLEVTGRDAAATKKHVLQQMAKEKAELPPGVPVRSVTVTTAVSAAGVNVNCFGVVTIGSHTVAAASQTLNRTARGGELERTAAWIVCGRLMCERRGWCTPEMPPPPTLPPAAPPMPITQRSKGWVISACRSTANTAPPPIQQTVVISLFLARAPLPRHNS